MKKLLYILLLSICTSTLVAQKFSATVNRNQVGVGEHFKITYTLDAQGSRFAAPSFRGFSVLSGPNQSQSMQYVNGQMSASISISYVLRAEKMGDFEIPPASIQTGGKTLQSNSNTVKVVKGTPQQQQQQQQQQQNQQGRQQQTQQPGNEVKDNVFIKLFINKRNVYVGEQITATYKIFTRLSIVDNAINDLPTFNGFYSQEVDEPGQGNLKPEIVNGVQYNTAIIKQVILSPQKSGKIEIDPLAMDLVLRVQDNRRPRSVFDQFFGSYRDIQYKAVSNKATINVERMPSAGKPSDFNGAVGSFELSSFIDKQTVKTNEAINLKIVMRGKGNVKLLKDPKIDFPPDFEVYDPKENTNIKTSVAGIEGTKTFEYLIIPRHSGEFTIPAYSFSYFDPIRKKYVTRSTDAYNITVERGENEPAVASKGSGTRAVSKKDVALLGSDIRYIKPNGFDLKEANVFFFNSLLFWILLALPLSILALLLIVRKRILEAQKDVVGTRKRKAKKLAKKHLAEAEQHLTKNDSGKFYEAVFKSIYGFISNKFNIPVSELNKQRIETELTQIGIEASTISKLIEILNNCEMARYAPVAAGSNQSVFDAVEELIEKIEEGGK